MNFLAHLHIADVCGSDMTGNLLGDFVKGDPSEKFSEPVVQGIRLHRFVDSYIDSHTIMKQAKRLFKPELIRFSPIALDMFWDHCLATQWQAFHSLSLQNFCNYAKNQCDQQSENLPERYIQVSTLMWRERWLESYIELDNIQFALNRMSTRSLRMVPLVDCFSELEGHYQLLNEMFLDLYPDILKKASEF